MSTRTYDPITPHTVAFLGMGVMGAPMAGHLARAGHQVTVYNRSAAKAQAWVAEFGGANGCQSAATPREAVGNGLGRRLLGLLLIFTAVALVAMWKGSAQYSAGW